ncbi:MAG: hypothetical protein LUO97_05575 [Methanomicrobiales archaeon]|nr:hypothetical protein [Methanomicrobiales archaeon]MDD1669251.1 hypothetical protein [Methanomicrobiales archaeon]
MKLNVKALSVALGIVIGLASLIVGEAAVFTGVGLDYVSITGPLHPGYSPTPLGALIMAIWMFIYGLIGGALVAAIYNYFAGEEKK